jgi:uracil-DNA glycosylase
MDLNKLIKNLETDWKNILLNKQFDLQILNFKLSEFYPEENQIFKCFNYFNIKQTKVVILGQDPYHNGQAIGLSFACKNRISPSLRNILKEVKCDSLDINLNKWVKQGVLLLNSSLTVIPNKPGSHIKYWQKITDYIIKFISENCNNIVFMLWGNFARSKKRFINQSKHLILESGHPSPLNTLNTFRFCNHFEKCNKYLEGVGYSKIEWC